MKEHKQLMSLAEEHDAPVSLCLAKNGAYINWSTSPPDEVLTIPESVFTECAIGFLNLLGERYYGTTGLSKEHLSTLRNDLQNVLKKSVFDNLQTAASEMLKFLAMGEQLSETHYLAFEGP